MGVTGLLPYLREHYPDSYKTIKLHTFIEEWRTEHDRNLRLGIDGYWLLHKYAFDPVIAKSLVLHPTVECDAFLDQIVNFVEGLRAHGAAPLIVFDGKDLPQKAAEEASRALKRQQAFEMQDWIGALDIMPLHAHQLIKRFDRNMIPYIVAPFEADAEIAYIARNNIVDAVLLCDSDSLIYGCPRVIMSIASEYEYWTNPLIDMNMDRYLYPLIFGCDYFLRSGIPGIGAKKLPVIMNQMKTFINGHEDHAQIEAWAGYAKEWIFAHAPRVTLNKLRNAEIDGIKLERMIRNMLRTYQSQPVFSFRTRWTGAVEWPTVEFVELVDPMTPRNDDTVLFGEFGYTTDLAENRRHIAQGVLNPVDAKPFEAVKTEPTEPALKQSISMD